MLRAHDRHLQDAASHGGRGHPGDPERRRRLAHRGGSARLCGDRHGGPHDAHRHDRRGSGRRLVGRGHGGARPRRFIQLGMGVALLVAAALMLAKDLAWLPAGGEALGLHGPTLAFAVGVNCLLGALMMLGVGLYAPCLILVSLLGMSPLAAFPIMMGSCALLMPVGGARFVRTRRYNPGAALGLTLGGIPGVLCAAFIVRSLPIGWLRWLVVIVVMYAAALMLVSGRRAWRAVA